MTWRCGGNKHFQRCVTCARAHSREAGVDSVAALFHRRDRVRHAKTQVMVSVHASLRFWFQLCFQGAETVTDIAHVHRTARIHHINTGRTVAFHQLCLLCEILRRGESIAKRWRWDTLVFTRASCVTVKRRRRVMA